MSGPPKEGTPNGVDRLARIEEWANDRFYAIRNEDRDGRIRDVLALVEIAKAARDIPDMDTPETDALYRALARLDSGATEGAAGGE